jgi:DNA-directed RNA polymerase specialized sigma24 family protein
MDDFLREVGGHAPHIVVTLFVRSQLPNIMESAVKHYRYKRGMSDHDAENLGQELVLKILTALTRACPRGNVGAWVRTIRSNVYWDHLRDQGRRARGMERLETAFNAMRK